MGIINIIGNRIIFQKRDETAVLEPWGKDCLRFRSSPNSKITDENWNLLDQPETKCSIKVVKKRRP